MESRDLADFTLLDFLDFLGLALFLSRFGFMDWDKTLCFFLCLEELLRLVLVTEWMSVFSWLFEGRTGVRVLCNLMLIWLSLVCWTSEMGV